MDVQQNETHIAHQNLAGGDQMACQIPFYLDTGVVKGRPEIIHVTHTCARACILLVTCRSTELFCGV